MFFILIVIVLSLLVVMNTYNMYRLTNLEFAKQSLMDMQEFSNIHPMIKELYKEAVVNGLFFLQNMIVTDIIKMNDIDKWYNANRKDILELIKVIKEKSSESYKKNKHLLKLQSSELAKLNSYNIKELTNYIKNLDEIDYTNISSMIM